MTLFEVALENWDRIAVWGLLATVVMTTVLEGAQLVGLTRLSLPFLFGTFVTGSRRLALIWGYVLYTLGGWAFAAVYALILEGLWPAWWIGLLAGLAHGAFLLAVFLPVMAQVHPRIATRYEGPTARRRLEPPGPVGLNYGRATPVSTMFAQAVYGMIFAIGYGAG